MKKHPVDVSKAKLRTPAQAESINNTMKNEGNL